MPRPAQSRYVVWALGAALAALLIAVVVEWSRHAPPVARPANEARAMRVSPDAAVALDDPARVPVAAENASTPPPANGGTLRVVVTGDDFLGIAGAHVCVWDDDAYGAVMSGDFQSARAWIVAEQDTRADGSARFDGLTPGVFLISARQDACSRSKACSVQVTVGETTEKELSLLHGIELRGVVIDARKEGVPGIEVEVAPRGDWTTGSLGRTKTVSGADGSFSFCGVEGIRYAALAVGATSMSDFVSFEVDPLIAAGEPLILELGGRYAVKGVVRDWQGTPVPKAEVRAVYTDTVGRASKYAKRSGYWLGTDGRTRHASTDERGEFEIAFVQPGPVQTWSSTKRMPRSAPVAVALTEDAPVQSVTLTLQPPATLQGVVVDEEGRALEGVSVKVYSDDPEGTAAELVTSAGGSFTADGLTAGDLFNVMCYPVPGTESVRVMLLDFDPASGPARLVVRRDLLHQIECRSLLDRPLDEASIEWVRCDSGAKGPALSVERAGNDTWNIGIPSEGGRYRILATIGSETFESSVWDPQSPGFVELDPRRADLTVTFVWRNDTQRLARYIARVLPGGAPSGILRQKNVMRDSTNRATVTWQVTPGDLDIALQCVTEKAQGAQQHVLVPDQGTDVTVLVPD